MRRLIREQLAQRKGRHQAAAVVDRTAQAAHLLGLPLADLEASDASELAITLGQVMERVAAELAVTSGSHEHYAELFERTPLPSFLLDTAGVLREVNSAACRLVGRTRNELIGSHFERYLTPDSFAAAADDFVHILTGDWDRSQREHTLVRADGSTFTALIAVSPVTGRDGSISEVVGIVYDVDEQRHMQAALLRSDTQLRALASATPLILWACDDRGRVTMSDGAGLSTLGLQPGDLVGKDIRQLAQGDPTTVDAIEGVLSGQRQENEVELEGVAVHMWYEPLINADGTVDGAVGISLNVTDQRRAQHQLEQSAHRALALARLARTSTETLVDLDALLDEIVDAVVDEISPTVMLVVLDDDGSIANTRVRHPEVAAMLSLVAMTDRMVAAGEGPIAAAIASREPVMLAEVPPDPAFAKAYLPWVDEWPLISGVAVPLPLRGRTIGALLVVRHDATPISDQDRAFLAVLADHAALAIDNGRLLASLKEELAQRAAAERALDSRAAQQTAVARLGRRALSSTALDDVLGEVCDTVASVLAVKRVSVLVPGAAPDELVIRSAAGVQTGEPQSTASVAPGSMARFGIDRTTPVQSPDLLAEERFEPDPRIVSAGLRSTLMVRVGAPDEQAGLLSAHDDVPREFTDDEEIFLQSVAHLIGAALVRDDAEARLLHRALHDPLTGLPNRALLEDRLGQALARTGRDDETVAVLFLDLDRFKIVNDALGHAAGDELLVQVARRLEPLLRAGDTLARLGGDEFVVCSEQCDEDAALQLAHRLLSALATPFTISDGVVTVEGSIGIALGVADDTPESVLRDADLAMYRAKETGRGHAEVFEPALRLEAIRTLELEQSLRHGLADGQLIYRFQPEVSLETGRVVGVEALLRWAHPTRGELAPSAFIDAAEETGVIVPIGRALLAEACRTAALLQALYGDDAPVVWCNLAAAELAQSDVADHVRETLEACGVDAERIGFEVTERVILADADRAEATLRSLRSLGVRLAIDDFGTGYSSLLHLRRFPVDVLKIDRTFIDGVAEGGEDHAIVRAVTGLAHSLGLQVVAEGVETAQQLERLCELGCDQGQGYLWARPMLGHELDTWLVGHVAVTRTAVLPQ